WRRTKYTTASAMIANTIHFKTVATLPRLVNDDGVRAVLDRDDWRAGREVPFVCFYEAWRPFASPSFFSPPGFFSSFDLFLSPLSLLSPFSAALLPDCLLSPLLPPLPLSSPLPLDDSSWPLPLPASLLLPSVDEFDWLLSSDLSPAVPSPLPWPSLLAA